jgi:hypothetical protein
VSKNVVTKSYAEIQTASPWCRCQDIGVQDVLHPRALVTQKYCPNAAKTDIVRGLLAIRQEENTVSKKEQLCIVMRHNDFDNGTLLHAVAHNCKVQQEGAPEHYFIDAS